MASHSLKKPLSNILPFPVPGEKRNKAYLTLARAECNWEKWVPYSLQILASFHWKWVKPIFWLQAFTVLSLYLILHACLFIYLELSLISNTYNWIALSSLIILHGYSCKILIKVCFKILFPWFSIWQYISGFYIGFPTSESPLNFYFSILHFSFLK